MQRDLFIVGFTLLSCINFWSDNDHKPGFSIKCPDGIDTTIRDDINHTWNVPVIFHVLYNIEKENIPDSLILGVLETLHSDFLKLNTDIQNVPEEFRPYIGNPNVNFTLATQLPNGQSTTGIIRQHTEIKRFKLKQRKMFSESAIIESKKYLNVYICDVNTNAFTPTTTNDKHKGVVIDYTKVSKESRTLTHEAGHWLGLKHIFQKGCKSRDSVDDTPAQKKHKHYCPDYPKIECNHSTMFMNFMDYSRCRYFFTVGQVTKMRAYIIEHKQF